MIPLLLALVVAVVCIALLPSAKGNRRGVLLLIVCLATGVAAWLITGIHVV